MRNRRPVNKMVLLNIIHFCIEAVAGLQFMQNSNSSTWINVQIQHVNTYNTGAVIEMYVFSLEFGTDQFAQVSVCVCV